MMMDCVPEHVGGSGGAGVGACGVGGQGGGQAVHACSGPGRRPSMHKAAPPLPAPFTLIIALE